MGAWSVTLFNWTTRTEDRQSLASVESDTEMNCQTSSIEIASSVKCLLRGDFPPSTQFSNPIELNAENWGKQQDGAPRLAFSTDAHNRAPWRYALEIPIYQSEPKFEREDLGKHLFVYNQKEDRCVYRGLALTMDDKKIRYAVLNQTIRAQTHATHKTVHEQKASGRNSEYYGGNSKADIPHFE
jgi:hypothetical protein